MTEPSKRAIEFVEAFVGKTWGITEPEPYALELALAFDAYADEKMMLACRRAQANSAIALEIGKKHEAHAFDQMEEEIRALRSRP